MKIIKNGLFIAFLMILTILFMPIASAKEVNFNVYGLYNGNALTGSTISVNADDFNTDPVFGSKGFVGLKNKFAIDAYFTLDGEKVDTDRDGLVYSYVPKKADKGKEIRFEIKSTNEHNDELPSGWEDLKTKSYPIARAVVDFGKPNSNGIMQIIGKTTETGITFESILVDLGNSASYSIDKNIFTYNLDTKKFQAGQHELVLYLSDGTKIGPVSFNSPITAKSSISAKHIKTYNNSLIYNPTYTIDYRYDGVLVQVKKSNDNWNNKYYGPFKSYDKKKITGLAPNTTYQIRTLYVKNYGTKNQLIGPVSNAITVKTGKAKKPAVKSIKISKVKVKKKYIPSKGWWDAGGVWHYVKGHYEYTTSCKVTIKLKKKPGAKGIYVGDYKLKGNKKKYTFKVKTSGNLKGKKVKVSIMSYDNDTYGAYSKAYSKKIKIK